MSYTRPANSAVCRRITMARQRAQDAVGRVLFVEKEQGGLLGDGRVTGRRGAIFVTVPHSPRLSATSHMPVL